MVDPGGSRLTDWLKQPASLLSLAAAVISAYTFYVVYGSPARAEIVLPDRVRIAVARGLQRLVIPLSITNTGSARNHLNILRITAEIIPDVGDTTTAATVPFGWEYEVQFVQADMFRQKYGTKAVADSGLVDVLDYVTRATTLHVPGGSSQLRFYELWQTDSTGVVTVPSTFRLQLSAVTLKDTVRVVARYSGCGPLSYNYTSCDRIF